MQYCLKLFEPNKHCPENCQGDAQTFLIYHHLYHHYLLDQHHKGIVKDRPPSQLVLVEGKPGTGKTFVTKTLRNITRQLTKLNSSDMASAPTGCAAALIEGSTHCHCLKIPCGRALYKVPSNIKATNSDAIRALKTAMCKVVCRIEDEHSMKGRPLWAWTKHRTEELRRPCVVLDDEENVIHTDEVDLSEEVYKRPYGGIPFIYSFCHAGQLPPVMMKAMSDKSSAKNATADHMGKIAIHEFMYSQNENECQSKYCYNGQSSTSR